MWNLQRVQTPEFEPSRFSGETSEAKPQLISPGGPSIETPPSGGIFVCGICKELELSSSSRAASATGLTAVFRLQFSQFLDLCFSSLILMPLLPFGRLMTRA